MYYFQYEKKKKPKTNNFFHFFSCLETEQYISLPRGKKSKQTKNKGN